MPNTLKFRSLLPLAVLLLAACGGGGTPENENPGGGGGTGSSDLTAPTVTAVAAGTPASQRVDLTVTATDNVGVTAYCAKTETAQPAASDACFQSSQVLRVAMPASGDFNYRVWARDAAGNVSTGFVKTLTADNTPPTLSAVKVMPASNGLTLQVTGSDNVGITGYCAKDSHTPPQVSDSCFTTQATLPVPDNDGAPKEYFIWARDAAGNLSNRLSRFAGGCSTNGKTAAAASLKPTVCFSTSLGEFVVELEPTKAPITVTNFLKYVNDGFYSQTVFHRIIPSLVVQGGGFTPTGAYKTPTYAPIVLEPPVQTTLTHAVGTIAMARTTELNSATNQFYINVVNNTNFWPADDNYAVFGRVIFGMDTSVQAIRQTPVANSQPITPPIIHWAYQLK